jgi:endonuclease YncB( thermonuclease family)
MRSPKVTPACLLLVVYFVATAVSAETLFGRVVGIADGDTLTILDSAKKRHKVRLAGIDSPERKQAFGTASKQSLSNLAFGETATVQYHKRDRYGRLVGKVLCPRRANCSSVRLGQLSYQSMFAEFSISSERWFANSSISWVELIAAA